MGVSRGGTKSPRRACSIPRGMERGAVQLLLHGSGPGGPPGHLSKRPPAHFEAPDHPLCGQSYGDRPQQPWHPRQVCCEPSLGRRNRDRLCLGRKWGASALRRCVSTRPGCWGWLEAGPVLSGHGHRCRGVSAWRWQRWSMMRRNAGACFGCRETEPHVLPSWNRLAVSDRALEGT